MFVALELLNVEVFKVVNTGLFDTLVEGEVVLRFVVVD